MAKKVVLQQKKRIQIPRGIKPLEREALARDIVNFIRKRTKDDNLDKKNQEFLDYEPEYAEWKGSDRVNLTLSGDMMENLKVLRHSSGSVTIGYDEDYEGMGKVHGNRSGNYGDWDRADKKPRDFLDITEADLKDLVEKYKTNPRDAELEEDSFRQAQELPRSVVERMRQRAIRRELGLDDGDF